MASKKKGDLSVTALYTSGTWHWGKLPDSELFESSEATLVFRVVNLALTFMRLFRWSLRSLRHALIHRHTMIDHLLTRAQPEQVLELACGLSRRGASFSSDASLHYTEVDLPAMLAHKKQLLERSEKGRGVLARSNLVRHAADISEAEFTEWVSPKATLFVIAEGLLMYLNPQEQRRLFEKVAALCALAGKGSFVFDWVPSSEQPKPGPVGRMLEWLMKRFTGGQAFERDERSRDDLRLTLEACGFAVQLYEPAQVAEQWELPHPNVKTQQLLYVCKMGY